MKRAVILSLVVAIAACRATGPGSRVAVVPSPTGHVDDALLQLLSETATGRALSSDELRATQADLRSGARTIAGYIDELVHSRQFAHEIAPRIVLRRFQYLPGTWLLGMWILKQTRPDAEGRQVFFLRKPCDPAQAEKVHPWWALDTEVLVCRDAHRPEVAGDKEHDWQCGGWNTSPMMSDVCGCGPNLVHCQRDGKQFAALQKSLLDEAIETVAYVVEHDLPIERVFTANQTMQNGYNRFVYARWQLLAGEIAALPDLRPLDGQREYRSRPESFAGEHAGILTTPQWLWVADAVRPRLSAYYNALWCVPTESVDVRTEKVLALEGDSTRDGDGWRQLASMPFCTNCHARLDYGGQFFSGWQDTKATTSFQPALAHPEVVGKLYARDIQDLRGEAKQTPLNFAKLAIAQPEFPRCMAQGVVEYVYNADTDAQIDAEVLAGLQRSGNLRDAMRAALNHLVGLSHWPGVGKAAPSVARTAPSPVADEVDAEIAVPTGLRTLLDQRCVGCHSEGERDFGRPTLTRAMLHRMLGQIATGRMPKGRRLDPKRREAALAELIAALWPGDVEQRLAQAFIGDGLRSLPVHHADTIVERFKREVGVGNEPSLDGKSFIESRVDQHLAQYTPGLAATAAFAALRACRAKGHSGAALDQCMQALSPVDKVVKIVP